MQHTQFTYGCIWVSDIFNDEPVDAVDENDDKLEDWDNEDDLSILASSKKNKNEEEVEESEENPDGSNAEHDGEKTADTKSEADADDSEDNDDFAEDGASGPDPELVAERMALLQKTYDRLVKVQVKYGAQSEQTFKAQQALIYVFTNFKIPSKLINKYKDEIKQVAKSIKKIERAVFQICTSKIELDRYAFISHFRQKQILSSLINWQKFIQKIIT